MNEIQVNIPQTALLEGLVDRFDRVGFTIVRFQLGGVEDVGSLETVVVDELADGTSAPLFVIVPIRGVLRRHTGVGDHVSRERAPCNSRRVGSLPDPAGSSSKSMLSALSVWDRLTSSAHLTAL